MTISKICVYAASSNVIAPVYKAAAEELGVLFAEHGKTLVYGGGNVGLMGVCARAVHTRGGKVIGVITDKLVDLELVYEKADELVITTTMSERKRIMADRADAFVALPGGLGTLDEIIEILVLKQLWYHHKACVFLNTNGIYDSLFRFLDDLTRDGFSPASHRSFYHVCSTPAEVMSYLEAFEPEPAHEKWF
ncbi:MAG TPA: TIGR00730 family Rossman fold protein [Candidatus Hydrogenedentes bacterium]|nr:MAG: LOG family protein YvdD [Candidatus Hydrogenedentes bacterium ADurb.Bin170]HNZ47914.1 TIGR00730 family Rossman fold protein [Candidatus Hydrogenedentota bacterium]HOD94300.1 TIGR00730 family Rossman fold protein [Candidatus Hydrogenedentota bacterium]HOR49960.1 TIGR00730 family Rossman fold protein [Candidatus Hydrogenedentota bacterium]HPK23662.1 TIGR00730 family Rossman fold protein [Candidatus Hydrogenedentota bacterium]